MHLLSGVHPRPAWRDLAAWPRAGRACRRLRRPHHSEIVVRSCSLRARLGRLLARSPRPFAGVAVRLMGRSEDEPTLRDAVLLTATGDDPGPAGRCSRPPKGFPPEDQLFPRKRWWSLPICWGQAGTIGCRYRDSRFSSSISVKRAGAAAPHCHRTKLRSSALAPGAKLLTSRP